MLDILAKVIADGGQLVNVSYALFNNDPRFIRAVQIEFTSQTITFRAVDNDDTLSVTLGAMELGSDELLIEANGLEPWLLSKGAILDWAWRLTNQIGYEDGVRLEFIRYEDRFHVIIEFIVIDSDIEVFSAVRSRVS